MPSLVIDDFSGGLNVRDSPNEVALNETPSATNWTLDERGALKWRNGCTNEVALPGVSGKKAYIFYSAALDLWLCARETAGAPNTIRLHTRPGDLSGAWTDRGLLSGNLTDAAAFVDWPANPPLVIITLGGTGTSGGTYTYNAVGPALTQVSAVVGGTCIALWQNKVWVSGYPTNDANGNRTRIFYSALGDPTTWGATTQFVDVREKDANPITALGVVSGALISFKKRSTYRHNDSTTGAFSTIDGAAGCVNPRAVVPLHGRLYVWGADGIYECDGVSSLKNVGDKLRPWYLYSGNDLGSICGGVFEDKVIFAGDNINGTAYIIEYSAARGWIVAHQNQSAAKFSSFSSKEATLYGAVYDSSHDDLWSMFTASPCLDNGVVTTAAWRTPWLLPNSGMLARLHRARIQGLIETGTTTTLNVLLYKDWTLASFDTYAVETALRAASINEQQRAVDIQSLGHASAFMLHFGAGTAAGAVSIRAIQLIDQSLAWPSPGYPTRTGRSDGPPVHSPSAA